MRSKKIVIYTPYHGCGEYCCACLAEVKIAAIDGLKRALQTVAMMAEAILIRKQGYGWECI